MVGFKNQKIVIRVIVNVKDMFNCYFIGVVSYSFEDKNNNKNNK